MNSCNYDCFTCWTNQSRRIRTQRRKAILFFDILSNGLLILPCFWLIVSRHNIRTVLTRTVGIQIGHITLDEIRLRRFRSWVTRSVYGLVIRRRSGRRVFSSRLHIRWNSDGLDWPRAYCFNNVDSARNNITTTLLRYVFDGNTQRLVYDRETIAGKNEPKTKVTTYTYLLLKRTYESRRRDVFKWFLSVYWFPFIKSLKMLILIFSCNIVIILYTKCLK